MTLRMMITILRLLGKSMRDRVFIITDGNSQYVLDDVYPDDKNPFVYLKISRES